jgi:small-conductance mechanosensitive channel
MLALQLPGWDAVVESLERPINANSLQQWGWAVGAAVALYFALLLVRAVLAAQSKRLAERFMNGWSAAVMRFFEATRRWFLFVVALYCGTLLLELPPTVERVAAGITIIAAWLQVAFWASALMTSYLEHYMRARSHSDPAAATTISMLGFLARMALWSLVLLLALENLGVDVTALVAGLGVGGIAVALAAQNILSDLFASLSIVLDKPFVLGDFIVVGPQAGTVDAIGLKTTRVRSLTGEQLVFANNDLLQSRIQNFKRMHERRIVFSVGVTYETPRDKLGRVADILREAVETQADLRFDRAHFKQFGPSSLDFEVVYYVRSPEYNVYMDAQQAVNLMIFDRFAAEEIDLAYPTQTLLIRGTAEYAGKGSRDEKPDA